MYLSAGQNFGTAEAGGVWTSKDKGKTWKKIFEMPYIKECVTSNVDPNIVVVNVGPSKSIGSLNPGVYISLDGGSNWNKVNINLGQSSRVTSIRPDQYDPSIVWCSLYGSGWFKGTIKR